MLAHDLKNILSILPEAKELIKEANIEQDYPLDNKDSVIASNLRYQYRIKVAGKLGPLDPEFVTKLEKAAHLYGVDAQLKPLIQKLEKHAEALIRELINKQSRLTVKQAEANFEGKLTGLNVNPLDLTKEAKEIYAQYGDKVISEEVLRYAGKAYFDKQAALNALEARAQATGKHVFTKVAEVINRSLDDGTEREVMDACARITELDNKTGLTLKGFNIYKEAMVPKSKVRSILNVKLCGSHVPYEKIHRLGKDRIGKYLGKDIGSSLTDDPVTNKQVLESLPRDVQHVLMGMLKSV
jgi:hypothetical protein